MQHEETGSEIAAALDQKALLPITLLDDSFYRHLESVTLRTAWTAGDRTLMLYVTVRRNPRDDPPSNVFGWEIEQDSEDGYRDVVKRSDFDEYATAAIAYEQAVKAIEAELNRAQP